MTISVSSRFKLLVLVGALPLAALTAAPGAASGQAVSAQGQLAVAWTDPNSGEGMVAAVRSRPPFDLITEPLPVGRQARLRFSNGRLYAISRLAGSITTIDPRDWSIERTIELGAGSEPVDLLQVSRSVAYVTRAGSGRLLELDLRSGTAEESTDLSLFADSDGVPDLGALVRHGRRLFVQVRRLNELETFGFEAPALLAVVDLRSEELIDVDPGTAGTQAIELRGTPPKRDMQIIGQTRSLMVGSSGSFFDAGGIERIDLRTLSSDGLLIREADGEIGADLAAFVFTCATGGFLTYSTDLLLSSHLHRFDLDVGVEFSELSVALDYEAPTLEHARRGGFLFVPKPEGIAVFSSRTGESLRDPPLPVDAPPSDIALMRSGPRHGARCYASES